MMGYQEDMAQTGRLIRDYDGTWDGISGESIARMRAQNKFRTGLDIARYTARIMRADMAAYDADPANRSDEHTSELQSLMRISYAVFCLKKNKNKVTKIISITHSDLRANNFATHSS